MSVEIELAMFDVPEKDLPSQAKALSNNCIIEDRSSSGWGTVIRYLKEGAPDKVDDLVIAFLSELNGLKNFITERNAILRVAIYTDSVGYTLRLNSFALFSEFGFPLEASIYPTE